MSITEGNTKLLRPFNFSRKGQELICFYADMAASGYNEERGDEINKVTEVYSDFELHRFRSVVKGIFSEYEVSSVLDYGCGGSDWDGDYLFDGKNAKEYFGVKSVFRYEVARDLDERRIVDLVSCFDVLEHIHVSDIPLVVRELFSLADRALLVNVACYRAAARLPNGENAHVTVRDPAFWLGVFSAIAIEFPNVVVNLFCSVAHQKVVSFPAFSAAAWADGEGFVSYIRTET